MQFEKRGKNNKKKSHRYRSCGILCLCKFIIVLGQCIGGMRCCLCVKLQSCKILPGLPKAYHPETGCRAYAEKTRPYYAIEGKTARFTRRSGRISCMGKGLIPNPVKIGFYCVTYNQNCTYEKTGRGGYLLASASRLFI